MASGWAKETACAMLAEVCQTERISLSLSKSIVSSWKSKFCESEKEGPLQQSQSVAPSPAHTWCWLGQDAW